VADSLAFWDKFKRKIDISSTYNLFPVGTLQLSVKKFQLLVFPNFSAHDVVDFVDV